MIKHISTCTIFDNSYNVSGTTTSEAVETTNTQVSDITTVETTEAEVEAEAETEHITTDPNDVLINNRKNN